MLNIYFADGVGPCRLEYSCETEEEAENWIASHIKGHKVIGPENMCTNAELASSSVGRYEVYDGSPITYDEDGNDTLEDTYFESDYFYTDD